MVSKISKCLLPIVLLLAAHAHALPLQSEHAIVVSDDTGRVLLEKGADAVVPIASLTKLMTAMVVLDSKPNMHETIAIEPEDVDALKHSKSHVPVGARLTRSELFELALMSSDNRAAASLARTYPGSKAAFIQAVQRKIKELGMLHTVIQEPTGLSPENRSTAADLARMAQAASHYPEIARITTDSADAIRMNGRPYTVHNTNRLVGAKGWNVLLSKTGFTNEAGHCLIMRLKEADSHVTLVLLNARADSARVVDAMRIRQYIASLAPHGAAHRHG